MGISMANPLGENPMPAFDPPVITAEVEQARRQSRQAGRNIPLSELPKLSDSVGQWESSNVPPGFAPGPIVMAQPGTDPFLRKPQIPMMDPNQYGSAQAYFTPRQAVQPAGPLDEGVVNERLMNESESNMIRSMAGVMIGDQKAIFLGIVGGRILFMYPPTEHSDG